MVFEKNLEEIDKEDLQNLIENRVLENKKLEYKQEIHLDTRDQKKEFLADISSFANASGGDIIYGIIENRDDGTPETLEGLDYENFDQLKGKIEGLIRDGTEPRVYVHIREIDIPNSKKALIIRIPKSWRSPHRIVFGKDYRFFSRNSNGKYHLDVEELKNAFNLSENLLDKIKKFREDRISNLIANESPVHLNEGAKMVLHIIPFDSFNPGQSYDIDKIAQDTFKLRPIYNSPDIPRYNIDGILAKSSPYNGKIESYTQLFRNGIIEAATNSLMGRGRISRRFHEEQLIKYLQLYLEILQNINVESPLIISLTLIGVNGFKMEPNNRSFGSDEEEEIDRNVIILPEVIIENYESKPDQILKPCFDAIYNACGYSRSENYNEKNEWF
jgi:hypothetical protein